MDEDLRARIGLSLVLEAGDAAMLSLVTERGAVEVWDALPDSDHSAARRMADVDPERVWEAAQRDGVGFITPSHPDWPPGLDDLATCPWQERLGGVPVGLWMRGSRERSLTRASGDAIAIVGSRAATPYGSRVAAELALELSEAGRTVISGAAYGIDAAAHRGALLGGGGTVAVLACGVDEAYPASNAALLGRIAQDHLIVSELPPGAHPTRMRFLARNRIIAALTRGTVIVEAAHRSGARNTVRWASDLMRTVMAVPGSIESGMSETPHRLIRAGEALLVTSAAEIGEATAPAGEETLEWQSQPATAVDQLDPGLLTIFEAVPGRGGCTISDLTLGTGQSAGAVMAGLQELEELGLVEYRPSWGWRLRPNSIG